MLILSLLLDISHALSVIFSALAFSVFIIKILVVVLSITTIAVTNALLHIIFDMLFKFIKYNNLEKTIN